MPVQITCPSCNGPLRVPENLFDQRVQCPTCEAVFIAEVEAPSEPRPKRSEAGRPGDDLFVRREVASNPGRFLVPHRGGLILGLGIASLITLSLVVCSPVSICLAIPAWVMGNSDLDAMRRGVMDRSGESNTQAGRICGMIATILMIFGCCAYGGLATLVGLQNPGF